MTKKFQKNIVTLCTITTIMLMMNACQQGFLTKKIANPTQKSPAEVNQIITENFIRHGFNLIENESDKEKLVFVFKKVKDEFPVLPKESAKGIPLEQGAEIGFSVTTVNSTIWVQFEKAAGKILPKELEVILDEITNQMKH